MKVKMMTLQVFFCIHMSKRLTVVSCIIWSSPAKQADIFSELQVVGESAHLHRFTGLSAASQHAAQAASQLGCILRRSLAQLGHCLEALGGQLGNGLGCHVREHHQAGLISPATLHHKEGGWYCSAQGAISTPVRYRPSALDIHNCKGVMWDSHIVGIRNQQVVSALTADSSNVQRAVPASCICCSGGSSLGRSILAV